MLQVTPQHRLLLAVEPIDFRSGIDGLKAACQQCLGSDPFNGTIFVFANRARTSVKLLVYDASLYQRNRAFLNEFLIKPFKEIYKDLLKFDYQI